MTHRGEGAGRARRGREGRRCSSQPGDAVCVRVDGGYSHEFTTAQVRLLPRARSTARTTRLAEPAQVRGVRGPPHLCGRGGEDGALLAEDPGPARPAARLPAARPGVQDYSAHDGVSPGICHSVARERIIEPGDFIQATDSHTCMGGANGALAYGVGRDRIRGARARRASRSSRCPEAIRFELGRPPRRRGHGQGRDAPHPGHAREAAGDARPRDGVRRAGARVALARRAGDARQHGHRVLGQGGRGRGGRGDAALDRRAPARDFAWRSCARKVVAARSAARSTPAACTRSTSARSGPWWRRRATRRRASPPIRPTAPSSPTSARCPSTSPTAAVLHRGQGSGPRPVREGDAGGAGRRGGSRPASTSTSSSGRTAVEEYARGRGYVDVFEQTGVRVIHPGCGACIGCGPGVSSRRSRSPSPPSTATTRTARAPASLYLASPLTVAASAVAGKIVAYRGGDVPTAASAGRRCRSRCPRSVARAGPLRSASTNTSCGPAARDRLREDDAGRVSSPRAPR